MKKMSMAVFVLLLISCAASSQTVSESQCAFFDNSRDSFYIEFERAEAIPDLKGTKVRSAILRFRNNLSCPIGLQTSYVEHFLVIDPSKPIDQRIQQRKEVIDGEFVPGLEIYEEFRIDDNIHVRTNGGGDVSATIILKGGNSLLFSVPFSNFKQKRPVVVRVEFMWEGKRGKVAFTGDTYHLVWFGYHNLPEAWRREIRY